MDTSKAEIQAALGLQAPPDDAFMALLARVGDADVVTGPEAGVLPRVLSAPAPAAMPAARANATECLGPVPSREA